jgi:hypothetical protein
VLTATVAAVAVGALLASGTKQHQVTMELDGRSATRATDAGTVGDLLREQHVAVGPLDRVVPGLQAHLDDGVVVRVDRDALAARTGEGAPALPSALDAAQPAVVPVSASPAPTAPPSVPAAATPPSSTAVAVSAASPATAARQSTPSSKPVTSRPVPVAVRPVNGSAAGGASWYASPFGSDSCASRTLKFGTVVTITNVQTGATATCRVADRGPVARSRVLDLDNDVFRRLSPLAIGVIPVQITW